MKSRFEHSQIADPQVSLTAAVSLADSPDFFEVLDNQAVLRLSRQGGRPGFRDIASLQRLTGVTSRRLLAPHVTPLTLVQGLEQQLAHRTGVRLSDCDAVLLCHSHATPDAAVQLAREVAAQLKLPAAKVLGWNFGCSGFIQLLCEAVQMLQHRPDFHRLALLNVETPETWHCSADRVFCGIVGAGATGVLLERGETPSPSSGLQVKALGRSEIFLPLQPSQGPLFHREDCQAWTFHGQPHHATVMRMNAEQVFVQGIELMLRALRAASKSSPVAEGRTAMVLPHQPSGKLLNALFMLAQQEFPNFSFLQDLAHHGNTISCTIPQILAELPAVCRQNSIELPSSPLLIGISAGICMPQMEDHMSVGFVVLEGEWPMPPSFGSK
jgi:3-oxoacyl-[acyl-carrier-protein] synthase III